MGGFYTCCMKHIAIIIIQHLLFGNPGVEYQETEPAGKFTKTDVSHIADGYPLILYFML